MADSDPTRGQNGDEAASDKPKQLPKGIVLGKDGKPCRSCSSFAAWAAQTRQKGQEQKGQEQKGQEQKGQEQKTRLAPSDCPADVEVLGRSTWTLLHSMAASYPETPTRAQQADVSSFIGLLARLYPCWVCAKDLEAHVKRDAPRVGSRGDLSRWLCQAHNDVNRKLGKPLFDCDKWDERWRTGWRDGRCD